MLYFPNVLINQSLQYAPADRLYGVFAALANPTRLALLDALSKDTATVEELAKPFNMTISAISKHLTVLEKAGFIKRSKNAQWRECSLEVGALQEVAQWAQYYEQEWKVRYKNLDMYLGEIQSQGWI